MKTSVQLVAAVAALCLLGCAASSVKQTSKAPDYQGGPLAKVAVLAVDERGLMRQGFENRFVRDLRANGQESVVTHDLLALPEIKANKEAASARLQETGADSILIVRLVNQTTYNRQVRATPELFVPVTTGIGSYYGWYDYYSVAYTDMGTVWGSTQQEIYLDSSLYDLKKNRRVWSALTQTTIKDTTDRLEEVDKLIAKVVAALRKDGMVR